MQNKIIYLTDIKKLEIKDEKINYPTKDEVLIKMDSVGICGSDLSYYSKGSTGVGKLTFPHILGHESAGTIVAKGEECTKFQIGERVAIEPGVPCGKCINCLEGHYNCCEHISFMSTAKKKKYSDGAFVKYSIRPSNFVYHLPDSVSFEEGALLEPLSVAYHAISQSGLKPGSSAAIIGCGPIAGCLLLMLKAFGIKDVSMSDINEKRLKFMENLGAIHTINTRAMNEKELNNCFNKQFNAIFDTSCNEKAINSAINQLQKRGKLVQVGVISKSMYINLNTLFLKEASIITSFRYANTYNKCISLIKNQVIDPSVLISHRFDYKDISKAFVTATNLEENPMKIIIKM